MSKRFQILLAFIGLIFSTLGYAQTAVTSTVVPPTNGNNGSFTVTVVNAAGCTGTYSVGAAAVVGSGPAGATPPPTQVTTYIGFPAQGFFFANAGLGAYTVTVTQTNASAGCAGVTPNPVVITVQVAPVVQPSPAPIPVLGPLGLLFAIFGLGATGGLLSRRQRKHGGS